VTWQWGYLGSEYDSAAQPSPYVSTHTDQSGHDMNGLSGHWRVVGARGIGAGTCLPLISYNCFLWAARSERRTCGATHTTEHSYRYEWCACARIFEAVMYSSARAAPATRQNAERSRNVGRKKDVWPRHLLTGATKVVARHPFSGPRGSATPRPSESRSGLK
jgi:hypothetical protein